jgi:hypothetical protein
LAIYAGRRYLNVVEYPRTGHVISEGTRKELKDRQAGEQIRQHYPLRIYCGVVQRVALVFLIHWMVGRDPHN